MELVHKLLPASKKKLVISSIGVLALVLFSVFVLVEATKAEVVMTDNGEIQTISTNSNTVGDLLQELGITVGTYDFLSHDETESIEDGMEITYKTAKQITVSIDDKEQVYYTTADTIEDFLSEQDLSFQERDEISHQPAEVTEDGLHIEVEKAYQVTINDGGEKKKVWTTGGTVNDLLKEADVDYEKDSDDRITPALDEEVTKGKTIAIVRVAIEDEEVTETIAFDIEERQDSSLLKGEEKVISEGEEGTVTKRFKVTKENGEEVSRELVSEDVKEESVTRVVAVGTKEEVQESNLVTLANETPKDSSQDGETITVTASAFTSECGGCSGVTATGINLGANPNMKVIAVDPNVIPLGSKVWVEGYGEAIAGDTGGNIKGNRIDVHVPSKSDAYSWGVKTVQVKVLN
ncbi:G5 and 3D domain-containing protein [Oceanobacillus profundus]|uniref:G5 and 3D domain-containing protein n=1 Tax=Oceanobacillus TaxID=182709 RepID=UPI0026E2CA50|nr:G5 and 3D domain-containing protein [Oceanobacillus profundus]MDO6451306.1 ubiquitin-like domain-containing protein [Oceanobacillus profundus]